MISKVMVVAPPGRIIVGLKALLIKGGVMTISVADAAVPVPALVVVTDPVLFTLFP